MIRKKPQRNRRQRIFVVANRQIRAPQVRVLDENGGMVGVMPTREAIEKAWDQDKDLILINDSQDPPIAKIIEIAKYKYQFKQKKAEGRKKAKAQEIKEIRLKPFMSDNDLGSRLKKIEGFLIKGDKVRLTLQFRGRQITKQEFGHDLFNRVFEATSEIGELEFKPKMVGRKLVAQLMPKKSRS